MKNALTRIMAAKRRHIAACKEERSLARLSEMARRAPPPRGFLRCLREAAPDYGLICEIKRASPSKGVIRKDFDPSSLARSYARGGATCLSVLTDTPFFQGADEHLVAARAATELPVLRKDFMIDPYQIVESRALGADCVLLIMALLDDGLARELERDAVEFGMDVLLEVHDADEAARALALDSPLIGINNRDLKSLTVDLSTAETLAAVMPADRLLVGESGLETAADLARLAAAGVGCFLIGESLMRQADVEAATRALLVPAA